MKRQRIARFSIFIGLLLVILSTALVAGAVQLENHDSFCASCHTEPESTYYERTQAETPSDLASAHVLYDEPVRCIDCHSKPGTEGRAQALWQGAQDVLAYVAGDYHEPAITQNPLGDAPCLQCHTQPSRDNPITPEEDANLIYSNSHFHWVEYTEAWLREAPNPSGVCGTCHESHTENTLAALGYRYMPDVNTACDDCHLVLSGQTP